VFKIEHTEVDKKYEEMTIAMCDYCLKVLKKEEPTAYESLLLPQVLRSLVKLKEVIY
jgi:hypothetical protein